MLPITVACPVYHRVPAEQFAAALESVYAQTRPAAEVLIIADGPLTPELEAVVETAMREHPETRTVRLPENRGTAAAAQLGFEEATQPWVARQDSDDLSVPERLERQWARLERGDLAALGSAMLEFEGTPDHVVGTRSLPLSAAAVRRYARFNNPVNNPTSIISTRLALEVGGVRPLHFLEDYDLIARLLAAGHAIENLPDALVLFRADPGMFSRRRDRRLVASEWQMQSNLRRYRLVSAPRMLANFVLRSAVRLLPAEVFKRLYSRVFRKGAAA